MLLELERRVFPARFAAENLGVDGHFCGHVPEAVVRRPGQPRVAGQAAVVVGRSGVLTR